MLLTFYICCCEYSQRYANWKRKSTKRRRFYTANQNDSEIKVTNRKTYETRFTVKTANSKPENNGKTLHESQTICKLFIKGICWHEEIGINSRFEYPKLSQSGTQSISHYSFSQQGRIKSQPKKFKTYNTPAVKETTKWWWTDAGVEITNRIKPCLPTHNTATNNKSWVVTITANPGILKVLLIKIRGFLQAKQLLKQIYVREGFLHIKTKPYA